MIKTTIGQLLSLRDVQGMQGPVSKLATVGSTVLFPDRIRISRFLKRITKAMDEAQIDLAELAKKHGDPVDSKNPGAGYRIREAELAAYQDEAKSLSAVEVEVSTPVLPAQAIADTDLTPRDLVLLEGMVELPE